MRYICSQCGDSYYSKDGLDRHEAKPHYPCPICGALRIRVNQHVSKAHREDKAARGRAISAGMLAAQERRRERDARR